MFSNNNNSTEVGRNGNIHIFFVGVYTRKKKKRGPKGNKNMNTWGRQHEHFHSKS